MILHGINLSTRKWALCKKSGGQRMFVSNPALLHSLGFEERYSLENPQQLDRPYRATTTSVESIQQSSPQEVLIPL